MKHLFLISLILLLLSACNSGPTKQRFYVVHSSANSDSTDFYSLHNFIIYNDTTIYYFKVSKEAFGTCGIGPDYSKPTFLNLYPKHLTRLRESELSSFWRGHVANSKHAKKMVVAISSPSDTIRNKMFWDIQLFALHPDSLLLTIRKTTEEENYVSRARFQKESYNPYKVKWRTGFDDGYLPQLQEMVEFISPGQ